MWRRFGLFGALVGGGIELWAGSLFGQRLWPAMGDAVPDHARLLPAAQAVPIAPDGEKPPADLRRRLTFCRVDSLVLAGVSHRPGQPPHLKVLDIDTALRVNWQMFAGPEQRYCPAGVYRWRTAEDGEEAPRLQIQAENCLHCKACEIKDPAQNILWTPPEGGDGPHYRGM